MLVFPTYVGMFPRARRRIRSNSLPHACGDVPSITHHSALSPRSSPRSWGCSSASVNALVKAGVFPMHVVMFLTVSFLSRFAMSLPHARGDVPSGAFVSDVHPCLPHASGDVPVPSTLLKLCLPHACGVFPKSKNFSFLLASRKCLLYKCFQRTDTCRFSFKSFVCSVPSEFQFTGQGMGAMVARHISALFVNLTFHLRRNHHVRRICSRSQFCYFFSRR